MISLMSPPSEIATELAKRLRKRRLEENMTQEGLARRSGVPLGTLKKFEASGSISLVSFIRLLIALGEQAGLDGFLGERELETLAQVLETPTQRQRGRIT